MAEKSSFFTSLNGDRKYKATDFAEYFGTYMKKFILIVILIPFLLLPVTATTFEAPEVPDSGKKDSHQSCPRGHA